MKVPPRVAIPAWLIVAGIDGGCALKAATDGSYVLAAWFLILAIFSAWLSGFAFGDDRTDES